MLGFKQFLAEDRRREGELLKDIQDLRKRTALLRFKDQYEAEKFKLQQQINQQKEREEIGYYVEHIVKTKPKKIGIKIRPKVN